MTQRVFVHIGLPKTGTSYLQSIVWPQRDQLGAHGLLVPGRERRDHLLASMIVRGDEAVERRGPGAVQAWTVLVDEIAADARDALVSHEFFCSAAPEQWRRLVADLAPAEVHVVITAREPLGLFTSSWQESLKNRSTTPLVDYGRAESDDPRVIWDWRALDLGLVLERLRGEVPDERVHVIVPPGTDEPRDELWRLFAGVLGIDAAAVSSDRGFANASMGLVEAELLRLVNGELGGFRTARDRARWIRTVLADRLLVTPDAERYWPGVEQIADARRRGERAVAMLVAGRYDVVGDVERLRVPEQIPERRHPADVTTEELLSASVRLNARLLEELRSARTAAAGPPPTHRQRLRLPRRIRTLFRR